MSSVDAADRPTIAIIDDDEPIRFILAELLADEGYRVAVWDAVEDPLVFVERVEPELTILDLHLTGWTSGWTVIRALHALQQLRGLGTAVIVCTADMVFLNQHGAELEQLQLRADPQAVRPGRVAGRSRQLSGAIRAAGERRALRQPAGRPAGAG